MLRRRFLVSEIRKILLTSCLLVLMAPEAMAQQMPKFELFGGYGYVRPEGGQASLAGWHASFAGNMNNWFGVVGEFSGQYGSQTLSVAGPSAQTIEVEADVEFFSFGFGPRLTYRTESVSPFVHALFGMARGNWEGLGKETSVGTVVGGGFEVKLAEHIGFRIIQADYVLTHFGAREKNFRLASGFTFSF